MSDSDQQSETGEENNNGFTGPIEFMARNPIAANLLMIILIAGGIWTAINMQKEVFPQYQLDIVEVSVAYPGAAPAEVEQGILRPVEEAIRGVQGIKEVTSEADEGGGQITIELVAGANRMRTFQDIDQAVNRIRTFPDDIEEPEVQLQSNQQEVMQIGLYGQADIWTLRKLAEECARPVAQQSRNNPGRNRQCAGLHDPCGDSQKQAAGVRSDPRRNF
ncbi:MAG: efflux RND transporter permease subunit [Balneolaceae bacterium]|nr:efflux RND transporter permease subunit [Balneolaceae bacterium]